MGLPVNRFSKILLTFGTTFTRFSARPMKAALALSALILVGCTHLVPSDAGVGQLRHQQTSNGSMSTDTSYRLHAGDSIEFKFFYAPELNEEVRIRPDGMISLQLIGEVRAAGLTPSELDTTVRQRYSGLLREPEVSVLVREYTNARVYVGGEVRRPGSLILEQPTTVLQAILNSGDFTTGAERRNVIVLRNDGRSEQPQYISLNLRNHIAGLSQPCVGDSDECFQQNGDIRLLDNDVVFVPEARISQVAEFFDQYVGKILPIYRNMGLSFSYELNDKDNVNLGN